MVMVKVKKCESETRVESQKKRWWCSTSCSVIWPPLNVRGSGAMVARDTPNVEVPGSSPGCR